MKAVRWLWLVVAVAAVYAGFTFFTRWNSNRNLERQAQQQEAEADRKVVDRVGGGSLKVLTFYASPPQLKRGQKGLLCYGVASAASVTITPPVAGVSPALSRCVEITPEATTEYTLTAKDAAGHEEKKVASVTIP